jgi:RNA polymerase sigma-70 factor (ECF subfamily)
MDERPLPGLDDRDTELLESIRSARDGDFRAFEELVRLHQKRILADCRYLTGDDIYAEDLAQEVFVKVYFALGNFEGRSSIRHWIQRIKVHHCLNHLKKHQGRTSMALEEEEIAGYEQLQVSPAVEKKLEFMDKRRKIDEILHTMPATLRIPLVMSDMDELSYDEIAAALGIGLSAVKMRIKRAREHFRRLYQDVESMAGEPAR